MKVTDKKDELEIENITYELRAHGVPENKIREVEASFRVADNIHKGQKRESGEPYIIHPLHVAKNLLDMEVYDADTISAALLHDTIEDAKFKFTKEDIADIINPTVAELVDGVTKISRMNFTSPGSDVSEAKALANLANTRKIINGLNKDLRIILIKLADRLHNMQTLEWKKPDKQYANAQETMELFVPLALNLGAYQLKNKLEDLSLQYLDPEEYKKISDIRDVTEERERPFLDIMANNIRTELANNLRISSTFIPRQLTVNTIYKKIKKDGMKIEDIDDMCYFKIIVKEEADCYLALYATNRQYKPFPGTIREYIANPRTNFYQSLHTTVADANGKARKIKIRTEDMNKIAAYGIPAYWNIENAKTIEETQEYIRQKFFAKKLKEFDESAHNNDEFVKEIYSELLTDHVYPYTDKGDAVELPEGCTALDFVIQVYPHIIDDMCAIIVNGKEVSLNTVLKNGDRVRIKTAGKMNHDNWEDYTYMPSSKRKIKETREKYRRGYYN